MISKKVTAIISSAAMLVSLMTPFTAAHAAETTLEVGADKTYKTISDAVAAAKAINPASESDRVTINVDPGDYEEQVRIDGMKYLTLQQTPGTSGQGRVNLSWYFCTNYYTSNTDLTGLYDPKIDWSLDATWNGYNEGDEKFTKYEIGQSLSGVSTISYYDTDGVAHKNVAVNSQLDRLGGLGWSYDKMAPLIVTQSSSDITIKDFNLVNSTVVMKTQGQDDGHLTPNPDSSLPDHKALAICTEDTVPVKPTADIFESHGYVDTAKYKAYIASQADGFKFTAGESAWLIRSSAFNERGHAIAILGDRVICENVRVRGNQDSVWITDGRIYFKNCDLIGGTDYIYGPATAVFDNCKLGAEGMTDRDYGATITAANTDAANPYGYLFYNCEFYNVLPDVTTNSLFGRPWGAKAQATFYKTVLDDSTNAGIGDDGWRDMSGNKKEDARFYEYGTTVKSTGAAVDTSKRPVATDGFGSVLDQWQILEFNPRNYFNSSYWIKTQKKTEWDPMNFSNTIADVDAQIAASTITVPAGEETTVNLPTSSDSNVEFHWESNSTNAVVSGDGTKLTVVRPAAGEDAIETSVILYARNTTTGLGDKKDIPVTIAATTDTENVFDIPVTINQTLADANKYTVTISKDGALIKQQVIDVSEKETTATIENIPASEDGIDYDIKIVSSSDQYSITTPEDGKTTVKGITGKDAELTVSASKLVDATASLSTIDYANASGPQYFDLIELAKEADTNAAGNIENSDIITIEYDFVPASSDAGGYIDLRSNTVTSNNTNADNKRYVLERVNSNWNQLDTVDCTQGFSGVQNIDGHQWLNISGKYQSGADITTTAHITTTINYKTKTITQSATGSGTRKDAKTDPFTFTGFPEADKGSMYLYMYTSGGTWGVKNVEVTYKRLATEDDKEADTAAVYKYHGNNTDINGGNQCNNTASYIFVDDVDEEISALFADSEDKTKVDADLIKNYKNYVGGTGNGASHPSISLTADAGKYKIYYLGYNHGNNITASVGSEKITAGEGVNFAYQSDETSRVLKVYTLDLELESGVTNETITFDSTDMWLPDLYAIVIAEEKSEVIPSAQPSESPIPTEDPAVAGYGKVVKNDDGSTTAYFGKQSITKSASRAKIIEETVNGQTILRADYFYPSSEGYGELTMGEIDLRNSGYNKVDILVGNRDTADVVIKVGGTEVASKTGVTTDKNWTKQTFTADLTTTEASGNITIEATVTDGDFCGNFAYLTFYNDGTSVEPSAQPSDSPSESAQPSDSPSESAQPSESPSESAQPSDSPSESAAPDTTKRIVTAYKDNGNTVVELANITDGVVIGAVYDGTALKQVKSAPVKGSEVTIEGIEADKVMVWNSLSGMEPVCAAADVSDSKPGSTTQPSPSTQPGELDGVTVDFTTMSVVPVYTEENGQGFVAKSSAIMPTGYEREVAPVNSITVNPTDGAKVTESNGSYLHFTKKDKTNGYDADDYNYGGLIYRVDTGAPGLYRLEVTVDGTQSDTRVAPTGMDASRLTGTSNWDNAGEVPRTSKATWSGSTWTYDFGTGEDFIEIEIEPSALATSSASKTVGVKSIKITPIDVTPAGDKPTIHILGDSTQKTYTFNETISAWGQTLGNYFDSDKVNVINYSMGGRAMKSNYNEGRFNEILATGKSGDYVFLHSAHNDETISVDRFSRGSAAEKDNLTANNANYNKWLNMYVEAIKARGMTPVLVTAMPRVNGSSGNYSESTTKPNGFNPDSPANMRAKAAADEEVGLAELYAGAKAYYDKLDGKEVAYIYNNTEAGETPANNAANGANGDGTHYKEAASKQFSRIILQSIYDQSVAATDTYTDKAIMQKLVTLMRSDVQTAAASENHDWSAVFPEMANDVSAVDVVPGATKQAETNYYYRNNIEKALQLGLLHKDTSNLFKPTQTITVGEYARGIEKAFGLAENSLTSYTKTYAELQADDALSQFSPSSVSNSDAVYKLAGEGDEGDTDSGSAEQFTVTVTQPTGGTVTVYNESKFSTVTVDVKAGVTANDVIANNDYMTLTAPTENVVTGSRSDGSFPDNSGISMNYVEFRNSNPEKKCSYTAKVDGVLTVYARFQGSKPIELVNKANSKDTQSKYINTDTVQGSADWLFGTVRFNVKEGVSYELYARGGTGNLFGVKYESEDYPQSTTSLTVDSGDSVRAVVVPDANYVIDGITVDGEKHTGREYTFTVTKDTTVSANLTSEPALVETTMVATDAPLTREIMGAILYDAYQLADKTNIAKYMSQNGGVPSPSDPNYDPNIKYEGSPYIPITGWGALTDKNELSDVLYAKVKAAYNLGLIRPETGIARGSISLGTELQPTTEVTRAKAAKSLVFAFILTQPQADASQKIPAGFAMAAPSAIEEPNSSAQTTVYTTAE